MASTDISSTIPYHAGQPTPGSKPISEPDSSLMAAVRRQDVNALQTLLTRHAGWATRFAERLAGGDHQLAEEVVQSAFMKLWDGRAHWEQRAQFKTWFYRIVHNMTIDRLRRRPGEWSELDESLEHPGPDPDQSLVSTRTSETVQQAILKLPPRQRAAIVLSHYEGLSQTEAAAALNINEGALESLLSRGRANLRKQLRECIERESH